ncbi:hypothetical protein D0Z03_000328 [Geotrichum reessii]|nr:hypothetical protein D0Z03_000328 [Galactomyces reessii]
MNDSHDTAVKSRRTVYAKPELKSEKNPAVKKQHASATAQETSNDVIDNEILEQQENQLKEHAIADTAAAAVLFDHAKRHQSQSNHNASSRKRSFSTSAEDNTALRAAAAVAAAAAVEDVSAYNNTVATAAAAVSNDDGSTTSATSAPVSVRTTSSAPILIHTSQQQPSTHQQQQQQHQPQQPQQQSQQPQVILHNQLSATVGPKPPVGSPEWHRQRRDNHKEVERRRRENINEGIHTLSQIVPNCDKNKGQILQRAAEYIRQLKETEATLIQKYTIEKLLNEQSIAELSNTNEKLKKELAQAWEEVKTWKKKAGEH